MAGKKSNQMSVCDADGIGVPFCIEHVVNRKVVGKILSTSTHLAELEMVVGTYSLSVFFPAAFVHLLQCRFFISSNVEKYSRLNCICDERNLESWREKIEGINASMVLFVRWSFCLFSAPCFREFIFHGRINIPTRSRLCGCELRMNIFRAIIMAGTTFYYCQCRSICFSFLFCE